MRLGEAAKSTGLSKRAIKYYEEKGLLQVKKDENGYRNYTEDDVQILKKISLYRKLDIGLQEIKSLLQGNDRELLAMISQEKAKQIQQMTRQWEELRRLMQTENIDDVCEIIDYETIGDKLRDMFPGFYGYYFLEHFLPYLQIPMKTKEQKEAYDAIVDFLDHTEIKIPFFIKITGYIMYRLIPRPSMEEMIQQADQQLKTYLHPTEEEYRKLKQQVKRNVKIKNSCFFRYHPVFVSQRHFMKQLQDCGYNDIFLPNMMVLSPKYKEYRNALMQMNERICKELRLYYDSDFRLIMK